MSKEERKERRKERIKAWEIWRKKSCYSPLYELLVLLNIVKSPTFNCFCEHYKYNV